MGTTMMPSTMCDTAKRPSLVAKTNCELNKPLFFIYYPASGILLQPQKMELIRNSLARLLNAKITRRSEYHSAHTSRDQPDNELE
jgi:hypothetical protein